MPDTMDWLRQNAWLLSLLAVLASLGAMAFLIALLSRQKRADRRSDKRYEATSRRMEEITRDMLNRTDYANFSEMQSSRLLQAMEERSRDEAQRLSALSARLDAFGEGQDARFHRVTAAHQADALAAETDAQHGLSGCDGGPDQALVAVAAAGRVGS